uniref:Uncharacterized protein n=1 Tax=Aplanochytrium stocchinoi TaxID=215587 RepID=A0A7S3LR48_9STRA
MPQLYPVYYGVSNQILGSLYFWMHSILIATIVFSMELVFKSVRLTWLPNNLDIAVEIDRGYNTKCDIGMLNSILMGEITSAGNEETGRSDLLRAERQEEEHTQHTEGASLVINTE